MTVGENIFRGGLLRFDMSKKPAYNVIKHLFTTNTEAETNGNGTAKFKGFYGDYTITADNRKFDITLKSNTENEVKIQL